MDCKQMQYRRESNGNLALYVNDGDKWIRYNKHHLYQKDYPLSTNSGFRTSQYLLKLGYKYIQTID